VPDLASAAAAAVVPGTVLLGKYRVERVVGQGGMGVVVQATHLGLDERVAIKFLRADIAQVDGAMARFLREAQAAAKLKSEHVARVMDVGTFDWGAPYMVMEFLDGIDLGVMLSQHGRLDPALVAELMLQTCAALAEAHAHGIIHRDIKPENLFITWRGDGSPLVKLVDFGISKAVMGVDVRLTQTQSVLGTPAYMSPEQMRSARLVDPRSDQWSIGVVLYELVAGRLPFQAESFSELVVQVVSDPPAPLPPDVPPALAAVIARCLAKSVDERYPSVAELGRALVPLVRDTRQAELLAERMARLPTRRAATPPPTALPTPLPGASSGLTEVPPPRGAAGTSADDHAWGSSGTDDANANANARASAERARSGRRPRRDDHARAGARHAARRTPRRPGRAGADGPHAGPRHDRGRAGGRARWRHRARRPAGDAGAPHAARDRAGAARARRRWHRGRGGAR
jgi:serine/threonine protein kinase